MNVKLFGIAKDIVGESSLKLQDTIQTSRDLRLFLIESYPEFKNIEGFMIAINQQYAEDLDTISAKDEIAIIPPVSGG